MFNTREMRLANFHVITYAKKLATEWLGRLMSQDSEMKQFRSEKSLMKFFFFKTILSDFALEQGPFIKTRHLSFYKGHLEERGK